MPRDPQDGRYDDRRSVEWRDPRRLPAHPRDEDVRLDRRDDGELFHEGEAPQRSRGRGIEDPPR
jgi:hypothetical protein